LKTFVYVVPPHTFIDYFQMSKGLAARCCDVFALSMKLLNDEIYRRIPDALDLKRIAKLHKERHGVNGMFGSLDCMHTPWKSCPRDGRHNSKAGKKLAGQPWCLKHCQIIIYGSGMHHSAMLGR
jgi:hypothetical protein